jgi:hypothetical protein
VTAPSALTRAIIDQATAYGPTWRTSALVAEIRRRLATCEAQALDGDRDAAKVSAADVAALALALAARLS